MYHLHVSRSRKKCVGNLWHGTNSNYLIFFKKNIGNRKLSALLFEIDL